MLPKEKTPKRNSIEDLTVLIYGPSKIGKSTLCSQIENGLFLATEPGLNSLSVYQTPIATWEEMLKAAAEFAGGGHDFKALIIDTLDNAFRMCSDYVCKKNNIEHESDLGYGKGFIMIRNEFYRVLNRLALLPYGLFLIAHSQETTIKTRTGEYTKITPSLPEKVAKNVLAMADIILFCDIDDDNNRVLRAKPSRDYDAGDRTNRLPETITLNYQEFLTAFNSAEKEKKK